MAARPEFCDEEWYSYPGDHRCPHDAWLESFSIFEIAQGTRSEIRKTGIKLRLLGAYHDGHIEFTYTGVSQYIMSSPDCSRGAGDWIEDTFTDAEGRVRHTITLRRATAPELTTWCIIADKVDYAWIPKPA